MASPNQQLLQHDTDTQTTVELTPEPTPELTVTVTPQATVMATATIAEHNPNSDTPMSEPPMAVPILVTGQTQPSSNSSTRRLPPPCWTPDETATLIDAYREKWYALRRGNLRAAHWEEVADEIHAACPDVSPPKTAVQCRHKMEKLRKRYRAELQRAKSIPHHRFSSSWIYFSRMQTMEKNGSPSSAAAGVSLSSPQPPPSAVVNVDDYNGGGEYMEEDDAIAVDDDDDEDFTLRSYKQQPKTGLNSRNFQPRVRVAGNNFNRSVNYGDYDESPISVPNLNPNPSPNYGVLNGNYGLKSGYANNYGSPPPPPPPQFSGSQSGSQSRFEKNRNHNASGLAGPSGLGMGMGIGMGMNYMNVDSMSGVGVSGGGSSNKKRKMVINNGVEKRGKERGDEAALEMVDAIRMLGEGFVRMEKMKMEMMRETERVRMEIEMKRTEMLLDSQHRIVEAFAKAWTDGFSNKE